jgi:hypothetical protein
MRIMEKRKKNELALVYPRVNLLWPRALFEAEARADAREQPGRRRSIRALKVGDRVSFDLGEGADGPMYATNVRLLDPT